jgi:hypothetical protein
MKSHEKRIEATYLSKCTPQAAYDWLFERRTKDVYGYCQSYDATLEYILLRRNEPLIDLAIARFGHSSKGIEKVFLRGSSGVRCAALSNPHIGYIRGCSFNNGYGNSIVIDAALHGTKAEQESLVKNVNLEEKVIEDLLSRKGLFENKSDDEYIRLLGWLGENPRMKTTFDDSGQRLDGPHSYSHDHVFFMAWDLAETLPVTPKFAYALYELLSGTKKVSATHFKDFPSVIERWRIEDETKIGKLENLYFYWLRRRLADLINPDDKLLSSNDIAERQSFYRRFSPWSYKDWPIFIEKDGKYAFERLVYNENLWMHKDTRKLLSDIAWENAWEKDPHQRLDAINTFLAAEKYNREKNPNWFLDEDITHVNSTNDIVHRLEENVKKSNDFMEKSFKDLDSKFRIDFDRIKEEIRERIDETNRSNSHDLNTISSKIESLDKFIGNVLESSNNNKQILWFIVTLMVIFILKNLSKIF